MNRGKFIVLEGIDGSGKTTLAKMLFYKFFNRDPEKKVILTFEPTKNILGRFIRFCLKHKIHLPQDFFQKLYFWDRIWHMAKIEYFLENGYTVVCDRNFFSTIAYGYSSGVDVKKIVHWHKDAWKEGMIIFPDFVFLIDVFPEGAIIRLKKNGRHLELFETEERLKRVAMGYNIAISYFPEVKTIRINGNQRRVKVFREICEKGEFFKKQGGDDEKNI